MCSQLNSEMPDSFLTKKKLILQKEQGECLNVSSFTPLRNNFFLFCQLSPFHHPKLKCSGHENAAAYYREHK